MTLKQTIGSWIINNFYLVKLLRLLNRSIRVFARLTHKLQFFAEWKFGNPQYFEHQMDLNWKWHTTRTSYSMERGVFSSFALKNDNPPNGHTLDLCCGDGFYSYYFYSKRSAKVIAMDINPEPIKFAKSNYKSADNIEFLTGDIRSDIPNGPFDNIIWDASIHYFTKSEVNAVITRIKEVLKHDGILSGYTSVDSEHLTKSLSQHDLEFSRKDYITSLLSQNFKNVQIFSTTYSDRVNIYFYASASTLPFQKDNCLLIH